MEDTATDPLASVGVPGPADTQPSQPIDPMYPLAPSQGASPLAGGGYTPPQTPVQEDPAAQFGGLIPSEAMPRNPDIEREYHESTWHRILDRVGTILGGGESIHYTKDADGNVSITHTPSTTGEKWGRVAAAALGGAAKGLAASQGPGGLAKAGSAGVEYGMNIPKQMQENVDAQATAEQKRMMANASHAMTQQDMFQKMLISQQLKTKVDQQSTDLLNAYRDGLQSSPDAKDFGVISNLDDLQKVHSANQDFLDKHTNLELKAALVPKAGGGTEIHAIATDPGDDARPVGKGAQLFKIEVDPKTHLPTLTSEEASPTTKKGTLRSYNQTVSAQYLDLANKSEDAQTRREKVENTPDKNPTVASLAWTAANDPDPAKRAAARRAVDLTKEKSGTGTSEGEGGAGRGAAATTPQETESFLKGLNAADAATVRAIGEIRNAPPNRTTKEGQRVMGLVNQAYPDYDSTNYPAYLKTKLDYAPGGVSGKGLNFIGTALAHMDRMEANTDALRNVSIPVVGSWYNAVKNAALQSTSPAIKAFVDDQKAVTNEIARAYNGGAITQGERDHMMELISTSDSPDAIRGSLQEFRELLHGKLDQYQVGWDAQMPRHQRNAVLDNLQARGTAYRPPPPAAAAPAAGGGAATPPAAQTIDVQAGTKTYHFKTQAEADTFKAKAGIKP